MEIITEIWRNENMTGGREVGGLEILHQKEIYLGGEASQQREQHVAGGGILHSSGHGSAIVFCFLLLSAYTIPPLLHFQKHK